MTWLDDVKAAYGKPRLEAGPIKRSRFEDDPEHEITSWVWFPNNINHCIRIKRYAKSWVVTLSAHTRAVATAEITLFAEPTDELMRSLLALTGFCGSANGSALTLSNTIETGVTS